MVFGSSNPLICVMDRFCNNLYSAFRGFKSFRSLAFVIKFSKKCFFGSSNPSTRRKIENGSMEIRKKLGLKKTEKSLEISVFLVFSCLHLNQTLIMAGVAGFGPTHAGVKVPCLTAWLHPITYALIVSQKYRFVKTRETICSEGVCIAGYSSAEKLPAVSPVFPAPRLNGNDFCAE